MIGKIRSEMISCRRALPIALGFAAARTVPTSSGAKAQVRRTGRQERLQAPRNSSLSVTPPRQNKRRRYIRAVFGPKDRRFPKRDPEIEAMYPGHCIPSSPEMLEELLRRSLELEQSVIAALSLVRMVARR